MGISRTTLTSLPLLIDESKMADDFVNVKAILNDAVNMVDNYMTGRTVIATNATIVNTAGQRFVELYCVSAGSIATITGMVTHMPFTLRMMTSGASFGLADISPFFIASTWIPSTRYGNITLVWDGTNYVEVGRVAP